MISKDLEAAFVSVDESLPMKKIIHLVDQMEMSADAKAMLVDLAGFTIEIGKRIVAIGRKIVSFAIGLVRRFPNTALWIVIALILGMLVTSVLGGLPLIGAVFAAKLKAILLLFGIAKGTLTDLSLAPIGAEVQSMVIQITPLAQAV